VGHCRISGPVEIDDLPSNRSRLHVPSATSSIRKTVRSVEQSVCAVADGTLVLSRITTTKDPTWERMERWRQDDLLGVAFLFWFVYRFVGSWKKFLARITWPSGLPACAECWHKRALPKAWSSSWPSIIGIGMGKRDSGATLEWLVGGFDRTKRASSRGESDVRFIAEPGLLVVDFRSASAGSLFVAVGDAASGIDVIAPLLEIGAAAGNHRRSS